MRLTARRVAAGVGNNPDSVASMRGANMGSGYAMPLRVIPERGQLSENSAQPSSQEACDVLHDDEAGSYEANESRKLCPKSRARAVEPKIFASDRKILTGKSAADDIYTPQEIQLYQANTVHVAEVRDVRPVPGQHAATVRVNFRERHGFHAGPFEAERKSANTRKQIEDPEHARSNNGQPAHTLDVGF